MENKVRLINIEEFSVDDGPGMRTVFFLKGCSLRCRWCHNPESIRREKEILIYDEKCIGCGACFETCANGAHIVKEGLHCIDFTKCTGCGKCAEECYADALVQAGEDTDIDRLLAIAEKNRSYFSRYGGGVTFSGGECLLQKEAMVKLLEGCKALGVHTAVDTCGNVPWETFEAVLPYADLYLYDIKAMDPEVHKACTGADNRLILSNLEKLIALGKDIRIRIPYIPGYNDGELLKIAEYLEQFPQITAELLGYHKLGNAKYTALRREMIDAQAPAKEEMKRLKEKYNML